MSPIRVFAAFAIIGLPLASCAQIDARQTVEHATACVRDVRASPEGRVVYARLWAGDENDNAAKLSDANPLATDERNALLQVHTKLQRCRQMILDHDNRYAAWETPYWQEYFQRTDAITIKLAAGELSVGAANKLQIESYGKFQVDVSRGHADAVRIEDAQRQRRAEALLAASAQILASQRRPQMTTTNCYWLGNNLNCTSLRQ